MAVTHSNIYFITQGKLEGAAPSAQGMGQDRNGERFLYFGRNDKACA